MLDPLRLYRGYHRLWLLKTPLLPVMLYRLNRLLTGCDLPPSVRVENRVMFRHWGIGVAVSPRTIIGARSLLLPHARVLVHPNSKKCVRITIAEQVQIGVGAVILATEDLEIGKGAQIGAGALVQKSVPPGARVMGCSDQALRLRYLPSPPQRRTRDSNPLINPVAIQKIGRWFYLHGVPIVPAIFYRLNYLINRCLLMPGTRLGNHVRICRWVALNPLSENGDGAVFHPGAITTRNIRYGKALPLRSIVIGKGVEIGAAAIVMGTGFLEIGDGAKVEEGAVVTRSIPPGCTVAGAPARMAAGPGEGERR